jgi:hypothetical protein
MTIEDNSDPPIEAIIGHWFAAGEVHIVFADPDGRQFYLVKETRERSYGNFLDPDQTWGVRDRLTPLRGIERAEGMLRAVHEAGHAVACILEGIRVEFITIVPSRGWNGERRLGFCQYDYRLPEALRNDCLNLAEKTATADIGGPWADYIYREQNGLPKPEAIRYAWEHDYNEAEKRLTEKAMRAGKKVDLDQEIDRLNDSLRQRFQKPWIWGAITQIATKLCDEGAISGQAAKEIVERAKPTETTLP